MKVQIGIYQELKNIGQITKENLNHNFFILFIIYYNNYLYNLNFLKTLSYHIYNF